MPKEKQSEIKEQNNVKWLLYGSNLVNISRCDTISVEPKEFRIRFSNGDSQFQIPVLQHPKVQKLVADKILDGASAAIWIIKLIAKYATSNEAYFMDLWDTLNSLQIVKQEVPINGLVNTGEQNDQA